MSLVICEECKLCTTKTILYDVHNTCLFICLFIFYFPAQLSIIRGRVSSTGASQEAVEGVVALALGGMAGSQFLDCTGGEVSNLEWRRENGVLTFPEPTRMNAKRLDLSNAQYSDEGIYTCSDSSNGQSVSINITGGESEFCKNTLILLSIPQHQNLSN